MKIRTVFSNLFQNQYEVQVVQLISVIGCLRVFVSLVQDLFRPRVSIIEVVTDASIFVVFALLGIIAARLKISRIPTALGIVLILLLAVNFLQFGGVTGFTEFNYLVGIVVIALLYSGTRKNLLVGFMLILMMIMLVLTYINHPLYQILLINQQTAIDDFVFSLIGLILCIYYLKYSMDMERANLLEKNTSLNAALDELAQQNQVLIEQRDKLSTAQQKLEREVEIRSEHLSQQNKAIQQYILFNTTELEEPLTRLKQRITELEGTGILADLLRVSCGEVQTVANNIKNSLIENEATSRTNIKPF